MIDLKERPRISINHKYRETSYSLLNSFGKKEKKKVLNGFMFIVMAK